MGQTFIRIQQGDRALFGELAEKYYNEVFRYCYDQTGNEHSAYDCTLETFCHLLRFWTVPQNAMHEVDIMLLSLPITLAVIAIGVPCAKCAFTRHQVK